jgi:hypothetical protein
MFREWLVHLSGKSKGSYTVTVVCANCAWRGTITLPRGTPLTQATCPKCSCKTLTAHECANERFPTVIR